MTREQVEHFNAQVDGTCLCEKCLRSRMKSKVEVMIERRADVLWIKRNADIYVEAANRVFGRPILKREVKMPAAPAKSLLREGGFWAFVGSVAIILAATILTAIFAPR